MHVLSIDCKKKVEGEEGFEARPCHCSHGERHVVLTSPRDHAVLAVQTTPAEELLTTRSPVAVRCSAYIQLSKHNTSENGRGFNLNDSTFVFECI